MVKKVISISAMSLILVVVLVANILGVVFSGMITNFLFGFGNLFGEEFERTAQKSSELANEIAGEGIIMLKNDNEALPLREYETNLNIFGWGATDGGFIITGSGSGSSTGSTRKFLLESLQDEGFSYNTNLINVAKNFQGARQGDSLNYPPSTFFRLYEPSASAYNNMIMQSAIDFSEVAIVVISRLGGENQDLPAAQYKKSQTGDSVVTDNTRTYLQLSKEEEDLLQLVDKKFGKLIVLLNTCNIMELGFINDYNIDSVLWIGALGQVGTAAVGKVLKGEITPSGRTVDTWVYDVKKDPTYINSANWGVSFYQGAANERYIDYAEGIYVGYKYYETAAKEGFINYDNVVQFPLGYGLSYTDFKWTVNNVSPAVNSALKKDDKIKIDVLVENIGDYSGQDVVQVYFTAPYTRNGIEKPYVQLAAFKKTVVLDPGQTQVLSLEFDVYDMASYDCYDKNGNQFAGYEVESGSYSVKLQNNSHTINSCAGAETKYTVAEPGIRYETDPVTGEKVENLFTGSTAYAGIPLDAGLAYMTRANFAGTFPTAKSLRAKGYTLSNIYGYDTHITDNRPVQSVNSGLSLQNEQTILELGADFDADLWEDLLSQMSENDLKILVKDGGYQTAPIASIGKSLAYDFDGPAGLNTSNMSIKKTSWTSFPVATVIAATWNDFLAYAFGLAVGAEAASSQVSGWYAPAVNMHRSPFGGRNFEYYSEDSFLSGTMSAETTRGAKTNGLYCYVKHFAVNETETHRSGLRTWMTEQALREIYLRPFEISVKKGGANAIMSSFNNIGPIWTGGCKALMTTILRTEWGFKGSVVTDYSDGGGDFMNIAQGLRAGNDLWLTGSYPSKVPNFQGEDTASGVFLARNAAKNILYTYCSTYYFAKNTEPDYDRFAANIGIHNPDSAKPYWWFGVAAIDLVAVGGVGLWIYFLFIRKKKGAANASEAV